MDVNKKIIEELFGFCG